MSPCAPLVDQLAQLIERTYAATRSVVPLGRFVVGDGGLDTLLQSDRWSRLARPDGEGGDGPSGARLLLRQEADSGRWVAALYLPDGLIETLEAHDPRGELHDGNVDEFATLVEEVDHLITVSDRLEGANSPVSLLELEWHAAVTKYLVLGHFIGRLTGRAQLTDGDRAFVEHHLFHKGEFVDSDPDVRERYRHATRLGVRFVRSLSKLAPEHRVRRLRRFHRASHHEKLRAFA